MAARRLVVPRRAVLLLSLSAAALACLLAWAGQFWVTPGIDPSARFWATCFFVLLLWPVGLSLLGHLAGLRWQLVAVVVLLALTVAQQLGKGTLPVPLVVSWHATLTGQGDAIRRQILLPPSDAPAWRRAWQAADRVVLAVCTATTVPEQAGVTVTLDDAVPVSLAAAPRIGKPDDVGWYYLPVSRAVVEAQRSLEVVLRREGPPGAPAAFCGGQDDPARPGHGQSWRWRDGRWSADGLGDIPIPLLAGRVPPQRYYVELRFLDADGLPHVAIWY